MRGKLLALLLSFTHSAPAVAQVSATAAPVSNSSGSVTNQAVMVTPSTQHRYLYGSGIQCDGPTLSLSPFVSGVHSYGRPNDQYYLENVYDDSDNYGLIDPETGLDGPDSIPDNPGRVLYTKPVRTGYRSNYSNNFGITATITVPLDWGPINLCKEMARKQVEMAEQALADKKLNHLMGRLKACATALQEGYAFKGPYAAICADVVLKPKPVQDHTHEIIYPERASDREWLDSGDAAQPAAPVRIPVSPYGQASD